MKKFISLILLIIVTFSCKNSEKEHTENFVKTEAQDVINEDYELYKPAEEIKAVLILFGGFPENASDIKREFKILNKAKANNISVLYMNYNRKIWLEENELIALSNQFKTLFKAHKLPTNTIYIGGFSSGGNIALLISDFLTKQDSALTPKGTFIVDSPVDLEQLYYTAEKNLALNFSESAVQESTWLLKTLSAEFGNPNDDASKYIAYSVFNSKTKNIAHLKHLKNTKIRLYTEPDTLWWKKNANNDYENMNAFYIKKLSETLKESHFKAVEYIATKNKGYRDNGERHPHSWSIIDKDNLLNWMLN